MGLDHNGVTDWNQLPGQIDFGRSTIRFSTSRIDHTPRMQMDAACTLVDAEGQSRRFFLSCPCIAESMYVRENFIHEPSALFNIILSPGDQFLVMKRHASSANDLRAGFRFGGTMPTHDGEGDTVTQLDVTLDHYKRVQVIQNYNEFREALLGNLPLNGRTTYTDEDGVSKVVLDYPIKTGNAGNSEDTWQVDAGPILMPTPEATGPLPVERLDIGFMVYNRWDYAEAVLRRDTPVGSGTEVGSTSHFTLRRNLQCRNELFAASL
ncbi:MAG: hypothetical protein HN368_15890 [Spirochaetales bacterium]|jgi:hypothetical protein|nr:hypothetical protein [Spirochaetales bacterium]